MTTPTRPSTRTLSGELLLTSLVLLLPCVLILMAQPAQTQTFTVLHNFNGADGELPNSGVTLDRAGNLYGTTLQPRGGTVYQLKHVTSGYVFNRLYEFQGLADGGCPYGGVVFGPDGTLYGTGGCGGGTGGYGVFYNLRPPATICKTSLCPWTETTLFDFTFPDGAEPYYGEVAFDNAGNVYGTTQFGGGSDYGVVYELSRTGNSWTQTVLHRFLGYNGNDGGYPLHNVILDSSGNIYGTTSVAGQGLGRNGTVFQLVPNGSGWTENILVNFPVPEMDTGSYVEPGLIMDTLGNLYGATTGGGPGTACVFELSPSSNGWQFTVLHRFTLTGAQNRGPVGNLVLDGNGNLYGTTAGAGQGTGGNIFKLSPSQNGWTYTDLYDFVVGAPFGDLSIDANGNLYGTDSLSNTVWMLTQ